MPVRPSLEALPSASSSALAVHHTESQPLYPLFAQLSFHVVPAHIEGELSHLYSWIEELGGRCVSLENGRYLVTALKGRMRLERVVGRKYVVRLSAEVC
jgi:DNA polymerase mu